MRLFDTPRDARRFLRDLLIALSAPLLVMFFLVQPFQVEGRSMQPRLFDGERILVNKLAAALGGLRRGDIVVFTSPADRRRYLVKRIVGLPGERLEIRGGAVLIDGGALRESYLEGAFTGGRDSPPVRLGLDEYFVLGDHRNDSEDSRVWGPIARSQIIGRAFLSYWPPSEAGSIR